MDSIDAAAAALLATRHSAQSLPVVSKPGVYAFFVRNPADLLPLKIDDSGLLYIGMTEDRLDARNHFFHKTSGFSTLRRSLGALLRQRLMLQAVPRGAGSSPSNITNYNFTPDGEARLTQWMEERLSCSCHATDEDVLVLERELIKKMMPPLCLKGWKNPQAPLMRALRKICSDEAWRAYQALHV